MVLGLGKLLRSLWARLLISALVFAGAVLTTFGAYDAVMFSSNKNQIEELGQRTLQRAELTVDYAVITLSELSLAGLLDCDMDALMQLRRVTYLRGSIKDIQVVGLNNRLLCAGTPMVRELGVANFDLDEGYVSSDGNISLHDIGLSNSGLMGVAWKMRPDLTFLAVLNLDSVLFDVFPAQLRDFAHAGLLLGADSEIAGHQSNQEDEYAAQEKIRFSFSSDRYPLRTSFELSVPALRAWNRGAQPFVLGAGSALGIILGLFSFSLLSRPRDPDAEMREGLKRGEFVPFMQPTFSVGTREIVGCEVLTRWQKCDGTLLPPFQFIGAAERNGLIVPMTRAIMARALFQLGDHILANPEFKVAFNVVPSDLVSGRFAEELCDLVSQAGVQRCQLVLELTERQEFEDLDQAIKTIGELRQLGFRVALDDTGIGHNGLSHVQQLGVDIIKIDKLFIDRVGIDRSATAIVQMLVRLADELGMRTVAEGIETEEQLKTLTELNVDEGQGYLVSRPLPVEEFLRLVSETPATGDVRSAA